MWDISTCNLSDYICNHPTTSSALTPYCSPPTSCPVRCPSPWTPCCLRWWSSWAAWIVNYKVGRKRFWHWSSMFSIFRLIKLISSLSKCWWCLSSSSSTGWYYSQNYYLFMWIIFSCWIKILPTIWSLWQTSLERSSIQLGSPLFGSSWYNSTTPWVLTARIHLLLPLLALHLVLELYLAHVVLWLVATKLSLKNSLWLPSLEPLARPSTKV